MRRMSPVLIMVLAASLSACSLAPPPAPAPPAQEPVEAFEAVGEPRRPVLPPTADRQSLSSDIERLQDARRRYEADQADRATALRRSQAECRGSERHREVPIKDGSGAPGVFCDAE